MTVRFGLSLAVLVILVLCAGCGKKAASPSAAAPPPAASPTMSRARSHDLAGKKVLMIIARDQYRDEELTEPKEILEGAGAEVTVACSSLTAAKGMKGGSAKPDVLLSDVSVDDYDAIVFVGGSGAKEYWGDSTAHALAKAAVQKDKVLGAICFAPVTLARAGVLEDKRATVWKSERGQLTAAGAEYVAEPVVIDGKIITGDGPSAATAFGKALARALAE